MGNRGCAETRRVHVIKGRLSWVGHSLKQEHATRLAFGQLSGVADESSETRHCVSHEFLMKCPDQSPRLQCGCRNSSRFSRDEAPPRAQRRGLGGQEAPVGGGEVARAGWRAGGAGAAGSRAAERAR